MEELLRPLLQEMQPHLERAKIKNSLKVLESKNLSLIYDQIVILRGAEYREYLEVWGLMTPAQWEFFETRAERSPLKQCKMFRAAKRKLREAWERKVKPLIRGTAPKEA